MKKEFEINTEFYSEEKILETIEVFKEYSDIFFENGNINIS